MSGIANVEHVYFYAAACAPQVIIQQYLDQAHALGRDFERPPAQRTSTDVPPAA
jgi:hypothetical protein